MSGAASGSYYRSQTALRPKAGAAGGGGGGGADRWKLVMLSTALFFPAVVAGTLFVMNFVGAYYDTSNAIPIKMMATIILLWMFVSFPLVLGGTLLGRSFCGATAAPCRIHGWPRPIPPKKWYYSPIVMIALTGILPFGSIFIEMCVSVRANSRPARRRTPRRPSALPPARPFSLLVRVRCARAELTRPPPRPHPIGHTRYFIFTSFWNYKFYYVYGFMLLVLFILSVVSVCITIVTTYFLLNAEDYRWQWVSFLSSGSTAFYVFLYSIYYFFAKTNMSGLMQTTCVLVFVRLSLARLCSHHRACSLQYLRGVRGVGCWRPDLRRARARAHVALVPPRLSHLVRLTRYYFGYMGLFCFAMWIVCGTIGRIGASVFVRTIFRNVKFGACLSGCQVCPFRFPRLHPSLTHAPLSLSLHLSPD